MKKKLLVVFFLVSTLALVPVGMVQAKKPLIGAMTLEYNMGVSPPTNLVPDWVGTITIDGEVYGMLFFAIGSGKPFDDFLKGKIHFFEEIWAIYDTDFDLRSLIPSGDTGVWAKWLPMNNPCELVLWGYDEGLTNFQNSNYHMNGNVEEANGIFSEWLGRNVHMSGEILWLFPGGPPQYAPGTFRIN